MEEPRKGLRGTEPSGQLEVGQGTMGSDEQRVRGSNSVWPAAEPPSDTTGHEDQASIPFPFPCPHLTLLTTNNLNNSNNSEIDLPLNVCRALS